MNNEELEQVKEDLKDALDYLWEKEAEVCHAEDESQDAQNGVNDIRKQLDELGMSEKEINLICKGE